MEKNAHLHLTESSRLLGELISKYDIMKERLTNFKSVVDRCRDNLSDEIMEASDSLVNTIDADLKAINKCIEKLTSDKNENIRSINNIEKKGGEDISKI